MFQNTPLTPKNPDGILRVLIFGRVSTVRQPKTNIQAGYEYARRHLNSIYSGKLQVKEIGARESGMLVERATILEAREDLESGDYDAVLMEDCSKSYRNPRWIMAFVQDCHDLEVRVLAPGDCLDTADENWELMLSAAAMRHGLHIPDTRRRIRRTADHSFQNGGQVNRVKYGYRRLSKEEAASGAFGPIGLRMAKISEATPVIYEAAARALRGDSLPSVVMWLIDEGILTGPYVKGGWTVRVLRDLLTDPILKGIRRRSMVVYQPIFATGKHRRERNPNGPQTKHEPSLAHLPDEMFDALQLVLARRGTHQPILKGPENPRFRVPRSKASFPFQHARCGICGGLMYGYARGNLRCSGVHSDARTKCWNHVQVKVQVARERIVSWVMDEMLKRPALREMVIDAAWDEYQLKHQREIRRTESFAGQIADVDRQMENVTSAIADLGKSAALLAKLRDLEKQQRELRAELRAQQSSSETDSVYRSRDDIAKVLEQAVMGLANSSYAFGDFMRRILVRFDIIPVKRFDTNYVRPRARLTLRVPTSEDNANPVEIHHEIDLFDPPIEIQHMQACVDHKAKFPKMPLRQRTDELVIGYMTVKRALQIAREMQTQGLTSPYIELTSKPASAARWSA